MKTIQEILEPLRFLNSWDETSDMSWDDVNALVDETIDMPPFYEFSEKQSRHYVIEFNIDADTGIEEAHVYDNSGPERVYDLSFTNLAEACLYVRDTKQSEFELIGDLLQFNGPFVDMPEFAGCFIDLKHPENPNKIVQVTSMVKHEEIKSTKRDYRKYLESIEEYRKDPKNFLKAYYFVSGHPAFWTKEVRGDYIYWEKHRDFWMRPMKRDNGEVLILMEAGQAVPPLRNEHYHDLELDVYSDTYENAIIEMAALVDNYFHYDGTHKYKKNS